MPPNLRYVFSKKMKQYRRAKGVLEVIAGRSDGTVFVPGSNKKKIYVRQGLNGMPFAVWNKMANAVAGDHLVVGELDADPGVLQIIDVPITPGTPSGFGTSLLPHGDSHLAGGFDPIYISTSQILEGLVYASAGLNVKVNPGWAVVGNKVVKFLFTTLDMTSHLPTDGAQYSLIRVGVDGVVSVQDGTPVDNIAALTWEDVPETESGYTTLGIVRTYADQVSLSRLYAQPDVIDVRFAAAGIGTINLDMLTDVTITGTPANNELLAYDTAVNEWINQTAAEASLAAAVHTHVETDITDLSHNAIKIQGKDVPVPGAGDDQKAIIYDHPSGDFIFGEAGGGGGGGDLYWFVDGALAAVTGVGQTIVAPYDMTISNVIIYVKENGSVGTTTVDVNINGASIFAGAKPTIAHDDPNNWTEQVPDTTAIVENDLVTVDIDAVATSAASLTVCVVVSTAAAAPAPPVLPNQLFNGEFRLGQRGTSFTAATAPANNDDTYLLDRWILLSDGNDVVDVTREASVIPSGFANAIKLEVETANKQFGILQILEQRDALALAGKTISLSFWARMAAADDNTHSLKAAILSWNSTADTVTSDVISVWGASPTYVANWTSENTPASNTLTTAYQLFTIDGILVDTASMANVAILIFCDQVDGAIDDAVYITGVKLEVNDLATAFISRPIAQELALCQRYYEKSFELDTAPAVSVTANKRYFPCTSGGFGNSYAAIIFEVTKHKVPVMAYFNSEAPDTGKWNWYTGAAGSSLTVTDESIGTRVANVRYNGSGAYSMALGHWTAEAEL